MELTKSQQECILVTSTPVDGVPEINEVMVVLGQVSYLAKSLCDKFNRHVQTSPVYIILVRQI